MESFISFGDPAQKTLIKNRASEWRTQEHEIHARAGSFKLNTATASALIAWQVTDSGKRRKKESFVLALPLFAAFNKSGKLGRRKEDWDKNDLCLREIAWWMLEKSEWYHCVSADNGVSPNWWRGHKNAPIQLQTAARTDNFMLHGTALACTRLTQLYFSYISNQSQGIYAHAYFLSAIKNISAPYRMLLLPVFFFFHVARTKRIQSAAAAARGARRPSVRPAGWPNCIHKQLHIQQSENGFDWLPDMTTSIQAAATVLSIYTPFLSDSQPEMQAIQAL
jgi:hypothetical protein